MVCLFTIVEQNIDTYLQSGRKFSVLRIRQIVLLIEFMRIVPCFSLFLYIAREFWRLLPHSTVFFDMILHCLNISFIYMNIFYNQITSNTVNTRPKKIVLKNVDTNIHVITSGELSSAEIKLPLVLMCRVTGTQRNVQYKLTFESSETALEVGELMPG